MSETVSARPELVTVIPPNLLLVSGAVVLPGQICGVGVNNGTIK